MTKKLIRRALPAVIEDLKYWQLQSDKKYQRIKTIIEQLCVNPKVSIGKPEPLKGDKTDETKVINLKDFTLPNN